MGLSIRLIDGDQQQEFTLATAGGWKLACDWIAGLEHGYPSLDELAVTGHVENAEELASELVAALKNSPPDNADVRHTLADLAETLGVGSPGESAVIVGVGGEED